MNKRYPITAESLARLELFASLNAAAQRVIAERGVVRVARADEVLWRTGAEPHGLAIVLTGEVRVVQVSRGRLRVIHTETAGGTLGEVPLFAGGRYPATAIATRSTQLLVVPKAVLSDAIRADPSLAFRLLERVTQRLRHVLERFERARAQSVTKRVAMHLLARFDAMGSNPVTLGSTQTSVAEEIGTVREVLVRALRELRERGCIRPVGKARYQVDRQALQEFVQTDDD